MSLAEFNAGGIISMLSLGNEIWYFFFMFIVLLCSYLLGSLNSAIIVSRLLYKEDIRTKGSKNAGMTNMLRIYGKRAALLTLLGDLSKTVISVGVAGVVFGFGYFRGISLNFILYAAGLLAVIGHIFPCYYRFKGGKGVLVTSTMALILTPLIFLALFLLFAGIVAISKYVSLGSVSVAVLYPVALNFYCHRENLKRIGERTENKISFGKKKKNEEE